MPEQTTTLDRTRQEARYVHLAAALARITDTTRHRAAQPNVLHEQLLADLDVIGRTATAAKDRTVSRIRSEYEVRWHRDGDDTAICLTEDKIGSLARARRTGAVRLGPYGITHYTVQRCVHVVFDDGWTAISPWEKVDERGVLFACGTCGAQVFRADSFVGDTMWFVDAEPTPDGELVLIPSDDDDGRPTGVYGKPAAPGRRRYRRHAEDCTPAVPAAPPVILAETQRKGPQGPPFSFITIRRPDGSTDRIDVPSHVKLPDGTMSDFGPDRLRVPLAEAGYRVVGSTTVAGRDVYAWIVEPIPADDKAAGAGVS